MRITAQLQTRLGETFALDVVLDLSLDGDDPVAALFGPSGCGKSSTLLALAGLLPVDGTVALDDVPLAGLPPEERGIGLVPQEALLFPHLTVAGNLSFAAQRARRSGPARAAVEDVLGLTPLLGRRPDALSGGERQRVAIGRALLAAPRLLLLDEPVSALDERARWSVLGFVERVVRELRVPTLYVSHQREEVLRLASVAARMDAGRVVETGAPDAVLGAPSLGTVWNLFRATGMGDAEADVAGRRVVLPRPVAAGALVWCRLSSGAITLRRSAPTDTVSARNRLPGRVVRVWDTNDRVRVAVDCGVALQIDLTPQAARELDLADGVDVTCEFKAHALEVFV